MSEDRPDAQPPFDSAEARRRLRNEAMHTVRRLSEALDQADPDRDVAADAQALIARLQAAVEPLRESVGTAEALALLAQRRPLSNRGTVGIHHHVHVHDQAVVLDSATVTITPHDATQDHTASSPEVQPGGSRAMESFQVTAEDVPWILWQVLLGLDDMANPAKPGVTVGQVYDRLLPLLSLLIALLPYLT